MIVTESPKQVSTAGLQKTSSFKIAESAHAFQILSSSLYSNKPLAVVRELCTNAYDSHIAANRQDQPFYVHIPTMLKPEFIVQDFGVGLSVDQVMELYQTYFGSTKNQDNTQVGGLGLGSKSPFAYTNTFAVTSRYNGEESVYAAFINSDGCPQIALFSTTPTTEGNGLTVQIPVREKDFTDFAIAAKAVLEWFPVIPTGNHQAVQKSWSVENDEYGRAQDGKGLRVLQGVNVYPIDADMLDQNAFAAKHASLEACDDLDVVLFANIGDVSIAPSREALSYDARTKRWLTDKLANISKNLVQDALDEIAKQETWIDAQKVVFDQLESESKAFRNALRAALRDGKFNKWSRDLVVTQPRRINLPYNIDTSYLRVTHYGSDTPSQYTTYTDTDPSVNIQEPYTVIYAPLNHDAERKEAVRKAKYLLEHYGNHKLNALLKTPSLILANKDHETYIQEGIPGLVTTNLSDYPDPPDDYDPDKKPKKPYAEKSQPELFVTSVTPGGGHRTTKYKGDIKTEAGENVYYMVSMNQILCIKDEGKTDEYTKLHSHDKFYFLNRAADFMGKNLEVIDIPKSVLRKSTNPPELSSTLRKLIAQFLKTKEAKQLFLAASNEQNSNETHLWALASEWSKTQQSQDPQIEKIIAASKEADKAVDEIKKLWWLCRILGGSLVDSMQSLEEKFQSTPTHKKIKSRMLDKYAVKIIAHAAINERNPWTLQGAVCALKELTNIENLRGM